MLGWDVIGPVIDNIGLLDRIALFIRLRQVNKDYYHCLKARWDDWQTRYFIEENSFDERKRHPHRTDLLTKIWRNEYIEKWISVPIYKSNGYFVSDPNFYKIIMGIRVDEPMTIEFINNYGLICGKIHVQNVIEYDPPYFAWLPRGPYCLQYPTYKFRTSKNVNLQIKVVLCKITTLDVRRKALL